MIIDVFSLTCWACVTHTHYQVPVLRGTIFITNDTNGLHDFWSSFEDQTLWSAYIPSQRMMYITDFIYRFVHYRYKADCHKNYKGESKPNVELQSNVFCPLINIQRTKSYRLKVTTNTGVKFNSNSTSKLDSNHSAFTFVSSCLGKK